LAQEKRFLRIQGINNPAHLHAEALRPPEMAALDRQWSQSTTPWRALEDLLGLRERLRKVMLAWEEGRMVQDSTIQELNRLMAAYPMRARLMKRKGEELLTETLLQTPEP